MRVGWRREASILSIIPRKKLTIDVTW